MLLIYNLKQKLSFFHELYLTDFLGSSKAKDVMVNTQN